MKTLVELQSEIHTLQQQAAELRSKEFTKTLADIVAQMKAFGITLKDVRGAIKSETAAPKRGRPAGRKAKGKAPAKAKAAPKAKVRKPAKIKYRGPAGETWSGRGKLPKWLTALVAAGRKADEFKV